MAGALPIRLVLVSCLRLRQARDLWVFNRNELKTKGLSDGKSRDKSDVRLESESVISPPSIPRPPNQRKSVRLLQLARGTQPTDAPSACRASGLLEQPLYPTKDLQVS